VTVADVNQAPEVSGVVSARFSEEDAPAVVDLLGGATDGDAGAVLSVTGLQLVSGDDRGITVSGSTLTVDPDAYDALGAGQSAVIDYAYTVSDGLGGTVAQTAQITVTGVNDASVAAPDTGLTISGAFTVIDALANDSDPEGAVLVLTGLTQPGNGVAVLTNDGRIAYRAASDFVGTDSFDYVVGDGDGGTATGRVDVSVVPETAPGLGTAASQIVALLYEAGLNRNGAIDAGGLNFWIDAREGGFTPRQLGNAFLGSGEFAAAFGAPETLTDQDLVEVLFRNVLDREGEAGGVTFWTTVVGQASFTRSDLLLAFAASPENLAGSAAVADLTETAPGTWDFV
jgi:hypothetical protein